MASRSRKLRKSKSSRGRQRRLIQSQKSHLNFETLEPRNLLAAIVVSTTSDDFSPDADTSSIPNLIANDGGDGISLREAIEATNNTLGEDTITFDQSVFTGGDNNVIRLPQGVLTITESLIVDGASVGGVVISGDVDGNDITLSGTNITDVLSSSGGEDGSGSFLLGDNSQQVLSFTDFTGDVTLSALTITGGNSSISGGGISFNSMGSLTLNQSSVSGNATEFHGDARGGGIAAFSGSVYLNDSSVNANSSSGRGGGIYSDSSQIFLSNSTVSGNRTAEYSGEGGGIFAQTGSVSLINSTVSENSTDGDRSGGGGIFTFFGDVSLSNSTVSGNSTDGLRSGGGGILALNGSVSLTNSTVHQNSTSGGRSEGGGIHIAYYSASLTLSNSTISDNSTSGFISGGGGLFTASGSISLNNSTVSGNVTASNDSSSGGGIYSLYAPVVVNSSTVANNSSTGLGGGISFFDSAYFGVYHPRQLTLANSIVAGNSDIGTAPDLSIPSDVQEDLTIEHSLVGNTSGSGVTATSGDGNVLNESALLDPLADNGGPTLTHNLQAGSPAIDAAGESDDVSDQRGLPFVRSFDDSFATGAGPDIGSVERQGFITLVVDNPIDENDGNFTAGDLSLREAIALAQGDPQTDSIVFDDSVFTGGDNNVIRLTQGELVISESLLIDATTVGGVVITGDANGDDITVSGTEITDVMASFGGADGATDDLLDDNSRVINFAGTTGNLTLTNLQITGGRTTDDSEEGGGIFFESSGSLTLNQSTVSGNSTTGQSSNGGGIYSHLGNVSLINSTVSENITTGNFGKGAGIFTTSGNVSLTNSTVSGNVVAGNFGDGGGIYIYEGDISLLNSTISGNSSTVEGGGIFANYSSIELINSTITNNFSGDNGGGINAFSLFFLERERLSVINSIVAGNTTNASSPDIYTYANIGVEAQNSLIGDTTGSGLNSSSAYGNIYNQPALLAPLADNGGLTQTHSFLDGSPAINAGSNTLAGGLVTDQRGELRIVGGAVDIGAFELPQPKVVSVIRDGGGVLARPDLLTTFAVTFDRDVNVTLEDLFFRK